MNFSHIALNCSDVAATIDYYTRHFGFKVSRRLPIGGDLEIVFIARDDVHLELFPVEGRSIPKEVDGPSGLGTLRHIAFQVDDVDFVACAEDELVHLWIPITALVTEMDACTKHIFH